MWNGAFCSDGKTVYFATNLRNKNVGFKEVAYFASTFQLMAPYTIHVRFEFRMDKRLLSTLPLLSRNVHPNQRPSFRRLVLRSKRNFVKYTPLRIRPPF